MILKYFILIFLVLLDRSFFFYYFDFFSPHSLFALLDPSQVKRKNKDVGPYDCTKYTKNLSTPSTSL